MYVAGKESEAEEEWDKEFDPTRLAESLAAAGQRCEHGRAPTADWSSIQIPAGKEDTFQGRLAARINAARVRMARFEVQEMAGRCGNG